MIDRGKSLGDKPIQVVDVAADDDDQQVVATTGRTYRRDLFVVAISSATAAR